MRRFRGSQNRLILNQRAATSAEYGLIASFLAIGILSALFSAKSSLNSTYGVIVSGLNINGSSSAGSTTSNASASGSSTSSAATSSTSASSQSSPTPTAPASSAPVLHPAFASKTQTSVTKSINGNGATEYAYRYSDGSLAVYTLATTLDGDYYPEMVTLKDTSPAGIYQYSPDQTDPTTGLKQTQAYTVGTYYKDGYIATSTRYTSFSADGTTMSGTVINYTDAPNGRGTSGGSVTTAVSQAQPYIDQYTVYKNNVASMK